jgi:protein subunit release factor A
LESEIGNLENEKEEIENQLAHPEIFKDEIKSKTINKRYLELQKLIPSFYEKWENAQVDLEQLLESIKK